MENILSTAEEILGTAVRVEAHRDWALFWPAVARAVGSWRPAWGVAEAPAGLRSLGLAHVVLAVLGNSAAAGLGRRTHRRGFTRAVTWDCGFAAPTPRMQYTAGSFAGTITEWFAWILRPVRHVERPDQTLPAAASFSEHTPETVLERVVEPAGGVIKRLTTAARALQHGRLHAYLLYFVLGLVGLAVLVMAGGMP